ncbi:FAD:protein FMN transferase [Desulfonema limicola]|uniref:FAD:protein FMN transferase n=1 Tax=Desulfonema limicola TaxID=45656 RepID=A0A975GJP5_9BACT|nr:FAD:protein FMN transferase [Desulfonema limicola]QTA83727.1 FAD:protein FMN transferase [Desulfonema limicola]
MKKITILIIFFLLTACPGKKENQEVLIQGRTMGTTFNIKVITSENTSDLEKKINNRLKQINKSMSTYDKTSEISRFNQIPDTETKLSITGDFLKVITIGEKIYRLTKGAWDGTIDPLINLWGFGRTKQEAGLPLSEEIQAVLPFVGFDNIEISQNGFLRKKKPGISLDLASIAKGYGVDQIAALITEYGFSDFLVEIGGEIYASGVRLDGQYWRIGINRPKTNAAFDDVYKTASLYNKAFATSGDYRQFFEKNGKRYSHVLDPRTGYPVSNRVVSATVIADNCTFADGLATALMVMGHEKGIDLVNTIDDTECLIIVEEPDGTLTDYYSRGFKTQS